MIDARAQEMRRPVVAVAGAGGDLGGRIVKALAARGADVRALTRPDMKSEDRARIEALGALPVAADPTSIDQLAEACTGAVCVVSALNGLRDIVVDRQSVLLDAVVKASVPRFISSDYAADFTKVRPGDNRNFDLRREFMARADRAPIKVTSVLNGAFMELLTDDMPLIQPRLRRVLYWGDAGQPLDFTTKYDTAAFTAAAALDATTPRILRVAGDVLTASEIADAMTEATGERYRTLKAGSVGSLGLMIRVAQLVAPQPKAVFPPWQGMQYLRDMFGGRGKLDPLDNDRYPDLSWTSVREMLAARPPR